ncbi:hypothetical protein Tco_0173971 [Tanacetum coccineum]
MSPVKLLPKRLKYLSSGDNRDMSSGIRRKIFIEKVPTQIKVSAWVGGLVPVAEGRWARPEAFDAKKGCLVILVGVRSRNHMKGWEQEQQEKRMLV